MKYYFKSKSKKYLLATILLLSLCPLLGLTYSSFIFSSDNYRASEMYIGSLMYGIKINDESVSKITVAPGETEVNIEITSLNTVSSFYKLIYKTNENILVEYNEDNDLPSGSISNTREITIKITNSSSSNIEVEFDIASGYITNTIEQVIIPQGYTEVTGVYIVNDINIVALYVNGEKVDTLDSSTNYELESYTCTNNEVVTWNNSDKSITITPITKTTECTLYFNKQTDFSIALDGNLDGNYYLTSPSCNNGATLGIDKDTNKLYLDNYSEKNTSCTAKIEAQPLLVDMPLGSYVSYTGTNGCPTSETTGTGAAASKDACSGKNANQNADTSNYTYGYCYSANYKFYTYGWRLAYTLDSDSDGTKEAYIVSAGSPECVKGTSSNSTSTIASLNAAAIKYCNEALAYGGTCQSTYNASTANAWAMNGKDYYNITNQWYGEGRRLYSYDTATENSSGTVCYNVYSTKQCGYNSDIIDNGGYYWFGSAYSSSRTLHWHPSSRLVNYYSSTLTYGARPVVHLKSTIRVKGGNGTMDNPYIIG